LVLICLPRIAKWSPEVAPGCTHQETEAVFVWFWRDEKALSAVVSRCARFRGKEEWDQAEGQRLCAGKTADEGCSILLGENPDPFALLTPDCHLAIHANPIL
jgi:hypothetical protein